MKDLLLSQFSIVSKHPTRRSDFDFGLRNFLFVVSKLLYGRKLTIFPCKSQPAATRLKANAPSERDIAADVNPGIANAKAGISNVGAFQNSDWAD